MADDAAIQARIAALAGAINRRKQQQTDTVAQNAHPQQPHANSGQPYRGNQQTNNHRWTPFPPVRGRGRGGYGSTYQNRTLVNNPPVATAGPPATTFNAPLQQQQNLQNLQEKSRLAQHFSTPGNHRELTIEGVRFSMKEDGSKLVRVTEPSATSPRTPKKAVVAGVEFFRTKNGNLLRSATINAASKPAPKPVAQCEHFIKNGVCPFGPKCRFDHNPEKVSMCKAFFRSGTCANGDRCDLSHKPTYNRVSACTHFMNGNCTNDACRYAHVSVSPGPSICRPFALLGYCEKGIECDNRHVIECPDYAEKGDCTNKKCKLPHTRHAHVERQKVLIDDDSELEEDEEEQADEEVRDVDSDDLDENIAMDGGLEIAENQDFISFS